MISKGTPVCSTSDSRHAPRQVCSLRAGTITDTVGRPVTMSADTICRIYYYSRVRRFLDSARCAFMLAAWLWLSACYSGTRPPRIGSNAPDFSVQGSDHKIPLSQVHGQIVVLNFCATWCARCVEELLSLVQMQQRMKSKGVT